MTDEAVPQGHPSWREGLDRSAPVWVLAAAALALLILLLIFRPQGIFGEA